MQRNADANGRAFAEAQEVHMQREILDRIEREIAWDHAVLLAVQIDIEQGGEEVARKDALTDGLVVDRDRNGRLVVTVYFCRHAASTTFSPSGPLAGLRTSGRLQFLDGRHWISPCFRKS